MTTQQWFSVPGSSTDFSSITPDAVVRAAQRTLGVTADGVVGRNTMLALARYVADDYNRARAEGESASSLAYLTSVGQAIGTVVSSSPIPLVVWDYLAKIGIYSLTNERGNPVVTGGAPIYRGPSLTPAETSTPASRTLPRTAQQGGAQGGTSPSDASASLATRLGAFYRQHRTAMNIAAAVAVVGTGVAIYMVMKDDKRYSTGDLTRADAEKAARILGISPDSDKQSIRAAAARALAAYQGPSDKARREKIEMAREVMLEWHENMLARAYDSAGRVRGRLPSRVR